ncbi:Mor transcription activator family protein [Nitrosomonas sp. Nm132]|uniref:Mor transcription activator family protein n=1 Tax=Nitrosomonas sp. Nm132 TaxID=1881053 RepID=UPI00210C21F1|nr:Mor transcription activator family protein [Nitrosomonas sp. Nm132]
MDIVGIDAALKLVELFGGLDHFGIPKAQAISVALRNSKIREEWPTLSQRQLALKYGLTERQVRKILAVEQQEESRQMGLF